MRIALVLACLLCAINGGSAELPATVDQTGRWTALSPAQAGLKPDRWTLLDRAPDGDDFPGVTSVLVARDGFLIYERYRDDASDQPSVELLRDTRSVIKTVTGMLIGIAIAQGHLGSVEDPVLALFSELSAAERPECDVYLEHALQPLGPCQRCCGRVGAIARARAGAESLDLRRCRTPDGVGTIARRMVKKKKKTPW